MISDELRGQIIARIKQIPFLEVMPARIDGFDKGYCEMTLPKKDIYDGVFGSLHGGFLITLADSAACFAVMTLTGADQRMATTHMDIRFLSPCHTDVTAKARVIKHGRSLCPVAVDLYDTNGKHVAVSSVTYMLLGKEDV